MPVGDEKDQKTRASRLIRAWEIAGGSQDDATMRQGFINNKAYKPHIPDNSGLTIGHGHDIGQTSSPSEIDDFYGPVGPYGPRKEVFTKEQRETLKQYVGKKAYTAAERTAALKATESITMDYDTAVDVFERELLPKKGIKPAQDHFPGFDQLPSLQQAAIIDRVYMRGPGVSKAEKKLGGEKMLIELKEAVLQNNTRKVLAAIKQMERLHSKPGTKARAKARSELATEGFLQREETGVVPWVPIG